MQSKLSRRSLLKLLAGAPAMALIPPAPAAGAPLKRPIPKTGVFCADEKRIRTENTVTDKSNNDLGWVLFEIADCAWMAFHPCAIGDPRGRLLVRAKSATLEQRRV